MVEGVNQTDFLKLFMQELTYQDPLKPIDNREFMAQMAQFSALQESQATNESLNILISLTDGNRSLMMLGKHVKIRGSDEEGKVYQIQFPDNSPPKLMIEINGSFQEKLLTDISHVWS